MSNKTVKSRVLEKDHVVINTMLLALSVEINRPVKTAELINGLLGVLVDGNELPRKEDLEKLKRVIESGGYNPKAKEG